MEFSKPSSTSELIGHYECEKRVIYRGEAYRVRDNGAVFREPKKGGKRRKLDSVWTFGRPCTRTGYMNHAGQRVHRIVASAFQGEQPSDQHVVDHIDTNRRNNRRENLRWITRLENILLNPITRRRIEICYGSLEEFFQDPSRPKGEGLPQNFDWMRTVSKDEAEASRERMEDWAKSCMTLKGARIDHWVFREKSSSQDVEEVTKESLTPGVFQRDWRIPTEFPACPDDCTADVLNNYRNRLVPGEMFATNRLVAPEKLISL
jgi:HNH endonuclease